MIKRISIGALAGLFVGIFAAVILVAFASVISFAWKISIDIPGVYWVYPDSSSGTGGLAFLPNFTGLGLFVLAVTVVFGLGAGYLGGRKRNAPTA
jgi:hypothetical protein